MANFLYLCVKYKSNRRFKLIKVVICFLEYKSFSNQHYSKFHHIKRTSLIKIKLIMITFATAIEDNRINAYSDASTAVA